jgi:hypothetical protein
MHMEAFLWLFLPVFVAAGSALLSFYIMQARMEVAISKERESLVEARAIIESQKATMEERVKATEEATRRATLDELMRDFRIEERSYMRDSKGLGQRTMIMQERMFFRNIPLSNWMEHEMLIEDGNGQAVQEPVSAPRVAVEAPAPLPAPGLVRYQEPHVEDRLPLSKTPDTRPSQIALVKPARRDNRSFAAAQAAFGAQ